MTQEKIQEIIDTNTDELGQRDMKAIGEQVVWLTNSRDIGTSTLRDRIATVPIKFAMADGFATDVPLEPALGPVTVDRIVKAVEGSV
jgi:hypothetical protein